MAKTIAVLLVLIGVAVFARFHGDGPLAHGDVVARAFGVELRVDLSLARPKAAPVPTTRSPIGAACVVADTLTEALVWH